MSELRHTARMVHHPACPDPTKARSVCACGQNVACSACRWGRGTHPCECVRPQPEDDLPTDAFRPIPYDGPPVPTPEHSTTPRDRVAVCGCVWRHFHQATQGWKWKCVKRCPEHDASAGHVVPQEPTS